VTNLCGSGDVILSEDAALVIARDRTGCPTIHERAMGGQSGGPEMRVLWVFEDQIEGYLKATSRR